MTKFMETNIPEIYATALDNVGAIFGSNYTNRVLKVFMEAVSECLGSIKRIEKPTAFVFNSLNGNFIMAAKVEYHPNEEKPDDLAAGNWSYVWTFDKEDIEDCDVRTINDDLTKPFFINKAGQLFGMKFRDNSTMSMMMTTLAECISNWLNDNAREGEVIEIGEEGIFKASVAVEGGEIVKSMVPEGDAKILIKGDSQIQAA